jgi:hypothetical protein
VTGDAYGSNRKGRRLGNGFLAAALILVAIDARAAESASDKAAVDSSNQANPPASGSSSASTTASAAPEIQQSHITLKDGRLGASFRDLPAGRLGEEISHKAGVAVMVLGDSGSMLVSANFNDLPVDEGLWQILTKQDVFFFYDVDEDKPSALKAVWIYPKGRGRGMAPVPPDKWASTSELSSKLKNRDPAARARAIDTLVQRNGAGVAAKRLDQSRAARRFSRRQISRPVRTVEFRRSCRAVNSQGRSKRSQRSGAGQSPGNCL